MPWWGFRGASTQDEFEFSAAPGAIADDAVEAAGYERQERDELVGTRRVEVSGETRERR